VIRRVIGLAVAFAVLTAAPAFAVDWTQAGRSAGRTGYNGSEAVLDATKAANLQAKWTYTAGGVVGSPIVAGGVAFFTTATGDLVAVDEATGVLKWSRSIATGGPPRLAVDKKHGIVVASWDGNLQAFGTNTGAPAWNVPGAGTTATSPTDPAIVKGKVFSATANGSIIAISVGNGGTLWEQTTINGFDAVTSPAVAQGHVLFVSGDGTTARLQALDVATGAPQWDRTAPVGIDAGPVVSGGVVYTATLSGVGDVIARSTLDGALMWAKSVPGTTALALAQGAVYASRSVAGTARSGGMVALDAATGNRLWMISTGGLSVTTPAAIANGLIYAGVSDERATPVGDGRMLVASTAQPGTLLTTSPGTDQRWHSAPAVVNGHVIVAHGADLYALAG
jgi:outer membrane protein assembly factor BamB